MKTQKKCPKTEKFNPSKTRIRVLLHMCGCITKLSDDQIKKLKSYIKDDNLRSICDFLGIEPIYRIINSEETKQQIMNFIMKTKDLSRFIDNQQLEALMLDENWEELVRLFKLKPFGNVINAKDTTAYIYQYLCKVTLANNSTPRLCPALLKGDWWLAALLLGVDLVYDQSYIYD